MKNEEDLKAVSVTVLMRAGHKVGGDALAKHLGVDDEQLVRWLGGQEIPPVNAILKAIDLLEPMPPTKRPSRP